MLLVDVVGPETRRCRSAWQCVYLVPIDAVDFPTIQKIMLELHELEQLEMDQLDLDQLDLCVCMHP